jgi:transcriptional regulator with XRE-family HTH domain
MELEKFCEFIFKLREGSITRAEMARKYPWHKNTIIGYEKDRLPDVDYLYAVARETGHSFADLIRLRLQSGVLQLAEFESNLVTFEAPNDFHFGFQDKDEKEYLNVEDDSMAPTILKGSQILVDSKDIELKQGLIYAFLMNNEVVPRRVQYGLNDEIILLAENIKYCELTLPKKDLEKLNILGRVLRCINPV